MRLTKTNISEFIEKVNSILEKKGLSYSGKEAFFSDWDEGICLTVDAGKLDWCFCFAESYVRFPFNDFDMMVNAKSIDDVERKLLIPYADRTEPSLQIYGVSKDIALDFQIEISQWAIDFWLSYNDVAIMKTTLAEVNREEYCGRGLVDLW